MGKSWSGWLICERSFKFLKGENILEFMGYVGSLVFGVGFFMGGG